MNDYLQTAFSGWAGVMLFGSGLAMPYLLRRMPKAKLPYLQRMWPHYWLGYLAFLVSSAHAWFAMRGGNMRGINSAGVWIATVALLVILWQIVVGLMLNNPNSIGSSCIAPIAFLDNGFGGRAHCPAYRSQQAVANGGIQ
jgi:hypothetical protein